MVLITSYNYIVNGVYKPTYNWGPHIVDLRKREVLAALVQPKFWVSIMSDRGPMPPCWIGSSLLIIVFKRIQNPNINIIEATEWTASMIQHSKQMFMMFTRGSKHLFGMFQWPFQEPIYWRYVPYFWPYFWGYSLTWA